MASQNGHAAKVNNDLTYRHSAPGPLILPVGPTCLGHFDYFGGFFKSRADEKCVQHMKNSPARICRSARMPSNWGPGVKPAEGIRRARASRREFGGRLVAWQIGGGYAPYTVTKGEFRGKSDSFLSNHARKWYTDGYLGELS